MPLVRYGRFRVAAVQCRKMNCTQILSLRTPLLRRLVILDRDYRIISAQRDGALEDALFGFGAGAARLPRHLEEAVQRATRAWTPFEQNERRMVVGDGLAMRVFRLVGSGRACIGVVLEQYHVRQGDSRE